MQRAHTTRMSIGEAEVSFWTHYEEPYCVDGQERLRVKCKHCSLGVTARRTRLESHLRSCENSTDVHLWSHYGSPYMVDGQDRLRVRCNYCALGVTARTQRLESHLRNCHMPHGYDDRRFSVPREAFTTPFELSSSFERRSVKAFADVTNISTEKVRGRENFVTEKTKDKEHFMTKAAAFTKACISRKDYLNFHLRRKSSQYR